MRRVAVILTVLLLGCAPHVSAKAADQEAAKLYPRTVYVANPEPGVRCYIVIDGYPATSAISCLAAPR